MKNAHRKVTVTAIQNFVYSASIVATRVKKNTPLILARKRAEVPKKPRYLIISDRTNESTVDSSVAVTRREWREHNIIIMRTFLATDNAEQRLSRDKKERTVFIKAREMYKGRNESSDKP